MSQYQRSAPGATSGAASARVVVTGAAGEIGLAIAQRFAGQGARLVLTDLDLDGLEAAARRLPTGAVAAMVPHDVSRMAAGEHVAEISREALGEVDALICCAGLYEDIPLDGVGVPEWRRSLTVNLDGVFYTIQALRPLLAEGSAIVNMASLAGHRGSLDHTPYATAKGGVLALTRSLAQELAPRTRVNAVSPGLIDTAMMQALGRERRETMIAATPLRRLGAADEVAAATVFLAGPDAGFITGETLQINGGLYLHS